MSASDDAGHDTEVAVVGGGPAGLSAALFTAKNGLDTTVFDTDGTWMHSAHLFNYLGVGSVDGDSFLGVARQQVDDFGADRHQGEAVTDVESTDEGFLVRTDGGDGGDGDGDDGDDGGDGDDHAEYTADYVVLATGADRDLAETLGCAFTDSGIVDVDVTMETSVEDAYATGAMVREQEWQTVISAGDGAAAALNVLTKERGEHFHDFDTPGDAEAAFGAMVEAGDD